MGLLPEELLAKGKSTGKFTYANCMNGCWRSHSYCKKHQSKTINCGRQLGVCIEYCESTFDPQIRKTPKTLKPKQRLQLK